MKKKTTKKTLKKAGKAIKTIAEARAALEIRPSAEAVEKALAMVGAYSARIAALESAARFHSLVLSGQGQINNTQVAINQRQEMRNNKHDGLHEEIDEFLDNQADRAVKQDEFNSETDEVLDGLADDIDSLAGDVEVLETANDDQFLHDLSRLDEICDYLNVERVPTWVWNEVEMQYDTHYVLVAKQSAAFVTNSVTVSTPLPLKQPVEMVWPPFFVRPNGVTTS